MRSLRIAPLVPLAALVLLAAVACGTASSSAEIADPTGVITVSTAHHRVRDGVLYLEGSIPEIRLFDRNGDLVAVKRVEQGTDHVTFTGLAAGHYAIAAAALICDGNCSVIDGPADPCRSPIILGRTLAVHVDFTDGIPCRIST